jgi:hypothetical protein
MLAAGNMIHALFDESYSHAARRPPRWLQGMPSPAALVEAVA